MFFPPPFGDCREQLPPLSEYGFLFYFFACATIIIAFFTDRRRTVGQRRAAHQQWIARVHQHRRSEPHHEQHENVARPDAEHHQIR